MCVCERFTLVHTLVTCSCPHSDDLLLSAQVKLTPSSTSASADYEEEQDEKTKVTVKIENASSETQFGGT